MRSGHPLASRLLRPPGRRTRFVLLGFVLALLLGACGTSMPVKPASEAPPDVLPKGAEIVHPTPATASDTSCNATASLPAARHDAHAGPDAQGHVHGPDPSPRLPQRGRRPEHLLWGYRDPTTGQLSGFDIDMLRQVADAIFGPNDPNDIHYTIVPNADRVQDVQKGLVDIVAETMTINCAREKSVDFSTVYYEAGQKILVPNNSTITGPKDLGGKRVCAPNGSTRSRTWLHRACRATCSCGASTTRPTAW